MANNSPAEAAARKRAQAQSRPPAVVATDQGQQTVAKWLNDSRQRDEIARALPPSYPGGVDRFLRNAWTAVKGNGMLLNATRDSLLGSLMHAGQLGLELGPLGHVYILPFNNRDQGTVEAQFVLGYKGMIDLALRSDRILSVEAVTVYEGEYFKVLKGTEGRIEHEPNVDMASGTKLPPARCWYAVVTYPNGGHAFVTLSPAHVEAHRMMSKSPNSPAWRNHFNAMAMKTAVRVLQPYLPMTPEVANAVVRTDEQVLRFNAENEEDGYIDVDPIDTPDQDQGDEVGGPVEPDPEPGFDGAVDDDPHD